MKWSEIKKWAKSKGYNVSREKANNTDEYTYEYTWTKNDGSSGGLSISVKNLAMDIYNHMTANKYLSHQLKYQQEFKWFKNEN
jgi:hypothetical protein